MTVSVDPTDIVRCPHTLHTQSTLRSAYHRQNYQPIKHQSNQSTLEASGCDNNPARSLSRLHATKNQSFQPIKPRRRRIARAVKARSRQSTDSKSHEGRRKKKRKKNVDRTPCARAPTRVFPGRQLPCVDKRGKRSSLGSSLYIRVPPGDEGVAKSREKVRSARQRSPRCVCER